MLRTEAAKTLTPGLRSSAWMRGAHPEVSMTLSSVCAFMALLIVLVVVLRMR